MKYVLLAALLIPSLSFACGGTRSGAPQGYQGNEDALAEIDRKAISCNYFGVESAAKIESYAMFRCINSPYTVELAGFGEKIRVTDVKKEGASYRLLTDRADTTIVCNLL